MIEYNQSSSELVVLLPMKTLNHYSQNHITPNTQVITKIFKQIKNYQVNAFKFITILLLNKQQQHTEAVNLFLTGLKTLLTLSVMTNQAKHFNILKKYKTKYTKNTVKKTSQQQVIQRAHYTHRNMVRKVKRLLL